MSQHSPHYQLQTAALFHNQNLLSPTPNYSIAGCWCAIPSSSALIVMLDYLLRTGNLKVMRAIKSNPSHPSTRQIVIIWGEGRGHKSRDTKVGSIPFARRMMTHILNPHIHSESAHEVDVLCNLVLIVVEGWSR